jgi:ABC-type antimicrobial peptide transport system permease subunit
MMVEDSKKLEQVLLGLGIILLVVALGFGWAGLEPHGINNTFPPSDAACGFAIAAGLCFVSAAIIHTKRQA